MFKKFYNWLTGRKEYEKRRDYFMEAATAIEQKTDDNVRRDFELAKLAVECKARTDWEVKNELAKKRDACFLGTKCTAFKGSYDDWLRARQLSWYQQEACMNQAQNAGMARYMANAQNSHQGQFGALGRGILG